MYALPLFLTVTPMQILVLWGVSRRPNPKARKQAFFDPDG